MAKPMERGHSAPATTLEERVKPIRRVSVIAPMRDEAENVEAFVANLAGQDFDGELEVLVADGNSVDGSVERLRAAADRAGLPLKVVDNAAGWVSPGLNACIRLARGDLIVRLDCHSSYPPDYLSSCARASEQTGAWNVGGRLEAVGQTPMERAIACAMDSPFGGIGWTRVAREPAPVETDTVTFGAFRPEAFARAGLFDETLVRNQDDEFNLRLRNAGGRIVLDPAITVRYRPRGTLGAVWRQYYEYGFWKVPVMLKHRRVLSARSMAPVVLVLTGTSLAAAGLRSATARRLLGVQAGLYGAAAVGFALDGLRRSDKPLSLLPRVAGTFPTFHLAYGLGMTVGGLRAVARAARCRVQRGHMSTRF
jgi:succinoglycan biosynthesis protein ExoA